MKKFIQRVRVFLCTLLFPEAAVLGYCLVLLLLTWSVALLGIDIDKKTTDSMIITTNDKLALAFEDHTRHSIHRVEQTLKFIKADVEANGGVTPSVRLLIQQQIGDPLINQSIVTNAAGDPLTSALSAPVNLYNAPQFQAHIKSDTGRVFIGRPRIGLISGKASIHISRRINHPDGSFAGMVSVALASGYFTDFYQSMALGTGHVVALVGTDGVVRAVQSNEAVDKSNLERLFEAASRHPVGNYVADKYYSYRILKDYPLLVQVGVTEKEAFAEFYQRRMSYLVGATGVSLLLLLYTALLVRISKKKRASQARYQVLMEQSSEALAVVDVQTQEIVELNRRSTELLGYSLPEDAPLPVNKVMIEPAEVTAYRYAKTLTEQRVLPLEAIKLRHKNGTVVSVERAGTLIHIEGRDYLLSSMRDLTIERRREAKLAQDVKVASRVQRILLPQLPVSAFFTLRSLYYPWNVVSGDYYQLEWFNEGTVLRGFLVDVSGHGVAMALQTASVNVLLREAASTQTSLLEQVQRVNAQVAKYFTEDSYATLLGFELDLLRRELRYVGAGITKFYINGREIRTPGMFIGMWENAEFETGMIPVAAGDCLHFLTDGLTDALTQPEHAGFWSPDGKDFNADVAALERLAESGTLRDDATGICLKIQAFL